MKIVYTGIQQENYNHKRSFGFEYNNFYLTLKNMSGIEVIEYPLDLIITKGKKKFNEDLLELIKKEKPDLFFSFMFTDELDQKILEEIKELTISIAWFADDTWKFYSYSRHWAPYFTWLITTYSWIIGPNIIRSQWACNPNVWRPIDIPRDIDVSFVGQRNSGRERVINFLKKAGINVLVRGLGWPDGRVSQEEMINIFSRSKINLNINDQPSIFSPAFLARLFLKRSITKIVPNWHLIDNFKTWINLSVSQVKARPFELAGCRAFVISGFADDLDKFYRENEEMVFYRSVADLIEKIKHYLPLATEREKIAPAGYQRTLADHTYEKRFKDIFKILSFEYE